MSRSVLATRFASLVGESPMQYLTRWRLGLAARALRSGNDAISRVAERSGYETEAAFSRAFKSSGFRPRPGARRPRSLLVAPARTATSAPLRRRFERGPCGVRVGLPIAVADSGPDRRDRAPEAVDALAVEGGHVRIGLGRLQQRMQAHRVATVPSRLAAPLWTKAAKSKGGVRTDRRLASAQASGALCVGAAVARAGSEVDRMERIGGENGRVSCLHLEVSRTAGTRAAQRRRVRGAAPLASASNEPNSDRQSPRSRNAAPSSASCSRRRRAERSGRTTAAASQCHADPAARPGVTSTPKRGCRARRDRRPRSTSSHRPPMYRA